MKSTWRILLAIFAMLCLLVGLFFYQLFGPSPPIVVSKQTTYLTEPLAEDGLPDYAKYLLDKQREGVTPENNAAIPFLQAMWPAELDPKHWAVVCEEIGMEVPMRKGFVEPSETSDDNSVHAAVKQLLAANRNHDTQEDHDLDGFDLDFDEGDIIFMDEDELAEELIIQCREHPWTREQLPPLADWIDRNATNFDLLHEAARRPQYYCPSPSLLLEPETTLIAMLLSDVQAMRSAVRVLATRAMYQIGRGDHAGACKDIRAIHGLVEHVPTDTLVGQLVLIACHGLGRNSSASLLNEPDLPIDVAHQMLTFYGSLVPRREMHNAMTESERLTTITTVLNLSGDREKVSAEDFEFFFYDLGPALAGVSIDWNVVLEDMNKWYDRLALAMKTPDFRQRQQALDAIEKDLDEDNQTPNPKEFVGSLFSRNARSDVTSDLFAAVMLPAVTAASSAEDRHNAQLQLMQVAAALAVYRCENGGYPESLAALVPALLPKLPIDRYHGKPLAYTKTADGYLLVNLGANGKDDGGSNEQMTTYRGYPVNDVHSDRVTPELLNDEPLTEFDSLMERIPEGADDWSIRLPLLPADWSALEPADDKP